MSQPNQRRRRTHKRAAFLAAYAELGNVKSAAAIAGCNRKSHYHWLKTDPAYAAAFEEAHELACQALEDEARRRAVEGVDEPVFQGGKQVGTIRRYSDTLLIFLLKGAMPHKYRERYEVQQSGHAMHTATVRVVESGDWYGRSANDGDGTDSGAAAAATAGTVARQSTVHANNGRHA